MSADDKGMLNNVYMLRSYTDLDWQGQTPPIADYERLGFRRAGAEAWRECAIPPHMAREYANLGLSPSDAATWGLIPSLVEAYMEVGADAYVAAEWVRQSVMPHQVPVCMAEDTLAEASLRDQWEAEGGRKWSDAFEDSDAQMPSEGQGLDLEPCPTIALHERCPQEAPPF